MTALVRIRRQHLALGLGLGLGALHCAGTRDANAPGMARSSNYPSGRFIVASETGSLVGPTNLDVDPARAQRECDQGDPCGCTSVGIAYERGLNVPRDMVRALGL